MTNKMRNIFYLLLLVTFVACTSSEKIYNDACEAKLLGQNDKAIQLYEQLIEKGNSDFLADAYFELAECYVQVDSVEKSINAYKEAAMLNHFRAVKVYGDLLLCLKDKVSEHIELYSALLQLEPDNDYYAAMLAKPYIFNIHVMNKERAAQLMMPFVNKSGTITNYNVHPTGLAFVAHMLANGSGEYVKSTESALNLVEKARKYKPYSEKDMSIDPDALNILGNFELITDHYMYAINSDNIDRALAYYKEAVVNHSQYETEEMINKKITIMEDFLVEKSKVKIDCNWWDREPGDWITYSNDGGFTYIGHTSDSDAMTGYPLSGLPTGWGYGVWEKEHEAFVGKWKNGKPMKGLYVNSRGETSLL